MTEQLQFQVLLFYKYVYIDNPEEVRDIQRALCERLGLKGRLIVAHEGINFTLEGTKEATEMYIVELQKDSRFLNIHFKRSVGSGTCFPRLSVKSRKEIVTANLGTCDVDPNQTTGKRLSPQELHAWFAQGREFFIVDMRNAYEHNVGHFEGSFLPPMDNFRDLPKVAESIKHLKNKTVLTVCTGGVRCEKASGFLVANGFADVYQLDGGIVSYMEAYPNENFLGKLYVFDDRITMGFYTDDPQHQVIGRCEHCDALSEEFVNCANVGCHRHFIGCKSCKQSAGGALLCKGGCTVSRHGRPVQRSFFASVARRIANVFKS